MLKNTETSYGSVTKWLHWVMAIWFVLAIVIIWYLTWDHVEGEPIAGLNYHKAVGFAILVPVAFRIFWKLTNPQPRLPAAMPPWQTRVSHFSHAFLYILMVVVPLSGWFGNGGGVDYGYFKIPAFRTTGLAEWLVATTGIPWPQWDRFFDSFHYRVVGPYVFIPLVLLHASAAIYHHVVQKDDVLTKMLPEKG